MTLRIGNAGNNYTVDYSPSQGGVIVSLLNNVGYNFMAQGDSYFNVKNIIGSAFNDILEGDKGNNTLTGGLGADTFVQTKGNDTITDFNVSQGDVIKLPGQLYDHNAIANALASVHSDGMGGSIIDIAQVAVPGKGGVPYIAQEAGTIHLVGVDPASANPDWFTG